MCSGALYASLEFYQMVTVLPFFVSSSVPFKNLYEQPAVMQTWGQIYVAYVFCAFSNAFLFMLYLSVTIVAVIIVHWLRLLTFPVDRHSIDVQDYTQWRGYCFGV